MTLENASAIRARLREHADSKIAEHSGTMPRTTLRYAIEKLPDRGAKPI
jgi:hypothetical protein